MSVSWAITDTRYERQPWKRENFDGYFTDIRRAARKSLPRRPNKDLCGLLGIPLPPGRLKPGTGHPELSIAETVSSAPVSLKPVKPVLSQRAERSPDVALQENKTGFDKLKAALLCRTSRTENCSKREKAVFGFSVYFAIIIFILLIIVLVLSTTLSRLNDNNDSESGIVRNIRSSTSQATTSGTTSATPQTSISSTKLTTTSAKSSSKIPPSSSSVSTSVPVSSPKTSSVSNQGRTNSTTVTTTTERVPVTSPSSHITTLSRASSESLSTATSVSTSEKSSTKSITSNTKSTLSLTSKSSISSGTSAAVTTRGETNTSVEITTPSLSLSSTTASVINKTTNHTLDTTIRNITEPTLLPTTSKITADPVIFPKLEYQEVTCTSSTCFTANKTLERVDFDTSPCVDFYEFSCGRWSQLQKDKQQKGDVKNIPQSVQAELRQNLLNEIKRLLQRTYREDESFSAKISKRLLQSCIESNELTNQTSQETHEIREIRAFLDPLGITADGNILNTVDAVLLSAVTRFEVSPFFKMSTVIMLDDKGINVHALKLEPTSAYLDYSIYTQPVNKGQESFIYVERLTDLLYSYISSIGSRRKRQTSGGISNSTVEYGEIYDKVLRAYFIESNISKILENTTSTSNIQYATFYYTRSDLKKVFPSINWDASTGMSRDVPIQFVNPDYFHALDNLWSNLDADDIKFFVFMNVLVRRVLPYTMLPLRSVLSDIGANGDMVYTAIDCVELSLNLAREEIHAIYIGQFTQKVLSNRLKLTNVKNKVSVAFQKYLSASTWVQPDLDRAVAALASNVKMHFSPLKTTVKQTMNVTGKSFLSLALELHRQKYFVEMSRLGSKATEITMDWTSPQMYFDAHFNAIGFPTGLTVYLNEGDLPFDIFGYIGMTMAEEFVKVLTGPLTGGIPPQWWGTTNILAFNAVPQCFSSQLSTFQNIYYDIGNVIILNGAFQVIDQVYFTDSPDTDRFITGTTINENMLFNINIAQLHCRLNDGSDKYRLIKERINNVMMNSVNFKRMFSCPDTSPLVSENTCSLFL